MHKLPKQWKYWCQKAKLQPMLLGKCRERCFWQIVHRYGPNRSEKYYFVADKGVLKKKVYHFKVNHLLHSECVKEGPIPKTEKEFLEFVKG